MTKLHLTPIIFGKNAIQELDKHLLPYKKILLVTGKSSIAKNGLYQALKQVVTSMQKPMVEYWGIKPNPTYDQIDQAATLGKAEKVDLVIAAGGGSAIDAAKVIATMIANPELKSCWDLVVGKSTFSQKPLDLISVVTLAGTASENNAGSVISHPGLNLKRSIKTRAPILALEDPKYTTSLSAWQTASGIFDCFSHITEQWFFVQKPFEWTDNYNLGLLKTLVENAEKVMINPNYEGSRDNLLFTSTMALNGLSSFNVEGSDWGVHLIAHGIAGNYDTTHGATLALVTPTYWAYMANKDAAFNKRALTLMQNLWNVSNFEDGLIKLREFIQILKLPQKFSDFTNIGHISETDLQKCQASVSPPPHVSQEDVQTILSKIPR